MDIIIGIIDKDIDDVTLESFAKALIRSSAPSQVSQLSQAKTKKNARSRRESIASIEDFGNIETLSIL